MTLCEAQRQPVRLVLSMRHIVAIVGSYLGVSFGFVGFMVVKTHSRLSTEVTELENGVLQCDRWPINIGERF